MGFFKKMRMFVATASVLSAVPVASSAGGPPTITSPTPGSKLSGPSVTFSISNNGTAVTRFYLYVGSSQGKSDYYKGTFSQSPHKARGLPTNGEEVHVRLWSYAEVGSTWTTSTRRTRCTSSTTPAPKQPLVFDGDDVVCPCFTARILDSQYEHRIASQGKTVSCMEQDYGQPDYPPYTEYSISACDNASCDLPSSVDAGVSAGFGPTGDSAWQAGCSVVENGRHVIFEGNLTRREVMACSRLFKASRWGQTCQ